MSYCADKKQIFKRHGAANVDSRKQGMCQSNMQIMDNRSAAVAQTRIHEQMNNSAQVKKIAQLQEAVNKSATGVKIAQKTEQTAVIQRKWDHLFNDIPKTLSNVPETFKRPALLEVAQKLIMLRDKAANGKDEVHEGEDQNAVDFGLMANSFLMAVDMYGKGIIDDRGLREATYELWKNSVDWDVAKSLGGRKKDIGAWNALEKDAWVALGRHF